MPFLCCVGNPRDPVNDQLPTKPDGVVKKVIISYRPPMIWVPMHRGTLNMIFSVIWYFMSLWELFE